MSTHIAKFGNLCSIISILKTKELFATKPSMLNDPLEACHDLTESHLQPVDFSPLGIKPEAASEPSACFCEEEEEESDLNDCYFQTFDRGQGDKLDESFRITSFTRNVLKEKKGGKGFEEFSRARGSDTLMWTHYGDNHKGGCIIFDPTEMNCGMNGSGIKVIYAPPFTADEKCVVCTQGGGCNNASHRNITRLCTKLPIWRYESETRMIYQANINQEKTNGRALKPFPISAVKAVILGFLSSDQQIEIIKSLLKMEGYSNVNVFDTQLDYSRSIFAYTQR